MKHKAGWRQRLRYAFDNTLSHGPAALIAWLALATVLLIVLAIAVDLLTGGVSEEAGLGVREVAWNILFQALVPNPPGNFDSPWQFLIIMLVVTIASLAIVSILIGLASATIQDRIEKLRRGHSPIVENNHTVILGWSEDIFLIISELVIANENQRRSTIAVLGEQDQVDMEDEIRLRLKKAEHTRIVCRRGSPTEPADLALVSPQTSKSIVILPGQDAQYPDAATIKAILALTKATDRRPEPYLIVAALRNENNAEIARLVGGDEVELILSADVVARIMAQTCRQAGLSTVYTELMDFEGDEIYFQEEPALVGKTFGEALLAYEDSAVIGLTTREGDSVLKPAMDTVIRPGDKIIAISEDDDTVRLSGLAELPIQREAIAIGRPTQRAPERTLILGWNWRAPNIVRQMDAYAAPGSTLTVVALYEASETAIAALGQEMRNLTISYRVADTTSRAVLDGLEVYTYDHVVVLCYSDVLENQRADALTLLTLLHLRRIGDEHGHEFTLVSEMMDVRNRNLAESARANDFIVSDRLVSLMLAQISENRALSKLFADLLDPEGVEIYLKPAGDYVKPGASVTFYTVVEAARGRGEVALGYRIQAFESNPQRAYGVVVNPDKSALVTFAPADSVIVLAEK